MADLESTGYIELSVSVDMADDLDQELLAPLRLAGVDAEIPPQGSGLPLVEITAIIVLANASIELLGKIAQSLVDYRRRKRQSGDTIEITIKHHGGVVRSGTDATDEELTLYIRQEKCMDDSDEKILRGAIKFLMDGSDYQAALILLSCTANIEHERHQVRHPSPKIVYYLTVNLRGPRAAFDALDPKKPTGSDPNGEAIRRAFRAMLQPHQHLRFVNVQVVKSDLTDGWREEQRASIRERIRELTAARAKETVETVQKADNASPAASATASSATLDKDVFIVYGHDETSRYQVAHYITDNLHLKAIMLDQDNSASSTTIVEEIERQSANVGYAIVLLTPDDIGGLQQAESQMQGRARQNVILELGYFWGKLGRKRLCILKKGDVEFPSDFGGILWVNMGDGSWREKLREKVNGAGLLV